MISTDKGFSRKGVLQRPVKGGLGRGGTLEAKRSEQFDIFFSKGEGELMVTDLHGKDALNSGKVHAAA